MKGSILCAGALLCSIFTVYSLVHPMDGVYGCILAIFLAVASSIFLKLGIDNIYVAIENQNELMKQSLSNKDDVVKLIDEKIKEVSNFETDFTNNENGVIETIKKYVLKNEYATID